ncbi:hypothetical protein BU14_3125s0001 [Porphyra umbilicalis]|uniref:Uncharacterized protein n=1 Tax=Porphyra umbilicalis TaxID=2786 RepID=A0A1X6NI14_PORUM|nr:hypothetical protein BU14_3125s0001 [Porphyra umbilicalis]|eukprot:OSX68261.1 hypothetical protein BU14_3125s0001 [Porphyra umbilicalis]
MHAGARRRGCSPWHSCDAGTGAARLEGGAVALTKTGGQCLLPPAPANDFGSADGAHTFGTPAPSTVAAMVPHSSIFFLNKTAREVLVPTLVDGARRSLAARPVPYAACLHTHGAAAACRSRRYQQACAASTGCWPTALSGMCAGGWATEVGVQRALTCRSPAAR